MAASRTRGGRAALEARKPAARRAWDRLRDEEVRTILAYARRYPDRSSRELACTVTNEALAAALEALCPPSAAAGR